MGRLIAIEGLDGAGKRTLADSLAQVWQRRGVRVGRLAFPRYGRSPAADLVRAALYGRAGDLSASVYGMAALYALDRVGAAAELAAARAPTASCDVVLLDRYVASNAAYGAARLHQGADGEFVDWVRELEIGRHGLPVPDLQLLLRVSPAVAATRAAGRAASEAERPRDHFESDAGLQQRVAAVYEGLAAGGWLGAWQVVDGGCEIDPVALVQALDAG